MDLHLSAVHQGCDSWMDGGSSEGLKDQRITASHSLTLLEGRDIAQSGSFISDVCFSVVAIQYQGYCFPQGKSA